jgi:hypothetical protein
MRVYLSPRVSRFISTALLMASFGVLSFVLWKTAQLWQTDPNLQQIQELLNRDNS